MKCEMREVVFLDIHHLPAELLYEFREFLRRSMINPIAKSAESPANDKNEASFSGAFTKESVAAVIEWLRSHDIEVVEANGVQVGNKQPAVSRVA